METWTATATVPLPTHFCAPAPNIRFLLVAPGAEIPATSRLAKESEPAPQKGGSPIGWIAATLVALAAAGAAAYFLF